MSTSFNPMGTATPAGAVGTYASEVVGGHAATESGKASRSEQRTQDLHKVVSDLNTAMKIIGTKLSFSVDSVTKRTVVRVVNSDTGELIRQIPSEAMLKISQNITALLGVLLDTAM